MVRVKYVNPVGTGELDEYFQEQLTLSVGEGVEIDVCHLELDDISAGPFLPREPFYFSSLFETLRRAQDEGYDAAVIGCSGDPGLFEARQMLDIPVTAPLEAALHLASFIHTRVAILVADGFSAHILYEDLARLYGFDHHISEILTVPMDYPDGVLLRDMMQVDPGGACHKIIECHRAALADAALVLSRHAIQRGAGVIYPGCTLWTGEMLSAFRASLGVPVIDPGQGAVLMAATAARVRRVRTGHIVTI